MSRRRRTGGRSSSTAPPSGLPAALIRVPRRRWDLPSEWQAPASAATAWVCRYGGSGDECAVTVSCCACGCRGVAPGAGPRAAAATVAAVPAALGERHGRKVSQAGEPDQSL